jgi:catechol 2,3-dioxygenase-like lactoylglutathione lyase family enzyme
MNHLGFSVKHPADVADLRDRMANAGFEVPDIQDLDSVTALFLKDPDGIPFEISHTPEGKSVVD